MSTPTAKVAMIATSGTSASMGIVAGGGGGGENRLSNQLAMDGLLFESFERKIVFLPSLLERGVVYRHDE